MPNILPATGQSIALKFAVTVDSSSIDPNSGGRRSLAAVSLSLARINGKTEKS